MMTGQGTLRPAGLILAVVLLFGVAGLVCSTLDSVRFKAGADEGFYLAYASRVSIEGPAAFPRLFADYLCGSEVTRYFPNPLRILTISLGAIALKLGGGVYFANLALLSLAAFLAVLVLMFVGTGRAFGWRTAGWTLLLACAAPLHLAMARRALSDTLVSAFLLGGLWLFLRAIWKDEGERPPLRWLWVALSFAAAFLVKESTFLLVPVALFFLGWRWFRSGRPEGLGPFLAVALFPAMLAGTLVVLAAGGIEPALYVARSFSGAAALNAYAIKYQNGPWFRFIVDFLLISPWPVLLTLVWIGTLIGSRVRDERAWFWALIPVLFIAMISFVPAGKNIRLMTFLEMPMRLCSVLLLQRITGDSEGNLRSTALMAAAIGCILWMDLQAFWGMFVLGGIYDPVSAMLLRARGFFPL